MNLVQNLTTKTLLALSLSLGLSGVAVGLDGVTNSNNTIEAQAKTIKVAQYFTKATAVGYTKASTKGKKYVTLSKGVQLSSVKSYNRSYYSFDYKNKKLYILKSKVTKKSISVGRVGSKPASKVTTVKQNGFTSKYTVHTKYQKKYPKTYEALHTAIKNNKTKLKIDMNEFKDVKDMSTELGNIFQDIDYNNPKDVVDRHFHYPTIQTYAYSSTGDFEIKYSLTKTKRTTIIKAQNNKIASVAKSLAKPKDSDYKKVKAVNNYLIKNMKYDYTWQTGKDTMESHLVYGGLTLKKGVCDSYSKTAEALLNYMGVEAGIMEGAYGGVGHSWNYVKIDGKYYYLDVTFNDSLGNDDYFLINTTKLAKDHIWDKTYYPVATSNKYMKTKK